MKTKYRNLQHYLDEKGMTVREAAPHFGVSFATISLVANGKRHPGGRLALAMRDAGIDISSHLTPPRVAS